MKYHRSTCKCTDASPSYVSRISVGKHRPGFPFYTVRWFKTATSGERPRGEFARKDRAKSPNRSDLSHDATSGGTPILMQNFRKVRVDHHARSNGKHHFAGYRRYDVLCSQCCANPSLTEINLRPGGDSQSYRFVWQLLERHEKDDGVITADRQI